MAQQQPSKIPRSPHVVEAARARAPIPVSHCAFSPPHPLPLLDQPSEGEQAQVLPSVAEARPSNAEARGPRGRPLVSLPEPSSDVPDARKDTGHCAAPKPTERLLAAPAETHFGVSSGPPPPECDRTSSGSAGQDDGPGVPSAVEKEARPAPGPAGAAASAGGLGASAAEVYSAGLGAAIERAVKAELQSEKQPSALADVAGAGPGDSDGRGAAPGEGAAEEESTHCGQGGTSGAAGSALAEQQRSAHSQLLDQAGTAPAAHEAQASSSGESLDHSSSAHTEPLGHDFSESEFPAGLLCTDSSSNETVCVVIDELFEGEGADVGGPAGKGTVVFAKEGVGSLGREAKAPSKAGSKQKRGKGKRRSAAPAVTVAGLSYTVYPHLPWVPPRLFSCFPRTCFATIPSPAHDSSLKGSKGSFKIWQRVLLDDISFEVQPRQILAITGSSASGKSVLLDAVAGRTDPGGQCGTVLVRGIKSGSASLQRIVAYAAQDEALIPVLTPRESLLLSASLRLGPAVLPAAKAKRVQKLLKDLDLEAVADVRIGALQPRGLLQGQRRRVSIGMDLVHNPLVLLLDEPTSGLDSHSALQVVQVLRRMADKRKRTIILTINQASARILDLVDNVLLLAHGSMLHHGTVPELEQRLELAGMPVPVRMNAVEYAIELLKTQPHSIKAFMYHGVLDLEANSDNASIWTLASPGSPPICTRITSSASSKATSAQPYSTVSRSTTTASLCKKDAGLGAWPWAGKRAKLLKNMQRNSVFMEVAALCNRDLKVLVRSGGLALVRMLQVLLCGLCLGTLFLNIQKDARGVQERMGFFAFSLAALLASSVEAIPLFLQERQVFQREVSSGAYRVVSYLLASLLVFLPFLLLLSVIFSASSYWLIGLNPTVPAFLFFILTMWTVLLVGHSMASCVVVIAPSYNTATALLWGLLGAFFLFSGYFITKENIPGYWVWMNYISVFKYPLNALLLNEYGGANASASFGAVTGAQILGAMGLSSTSQWAQLGILAAMAVGYQALRFLALTWHKSKRR